MDKAVFMVINALIALGVAVVVVFFDIPMLTGGVNANEKDPSRPGHLRGFNAWPPFLVHVAIFAVCFTFAFCIWRTFRRPSPSGR